MLVDYLLYASEVAGSGTSAARGFVDRCSMKNEMNLNRILGRTRILTRQKLFISNENNLFDRRN